MHPDMIHAAIAEQARKIEQERAVVEAAKAKKQNL